MTSDIVAGKAAWARLKNGSKNWQDWVQPRAAGGPRHRDA
jgi:hypothetical protein